MSSRTNINKSQYSKHSNKSSNISLSRPSKGVESFLDDSLMNPSEDNIFNFKIPSHLSSSVKKNPIAHLKFKIFCNQVILDVARNELDENIGEIITIHPYSANNQEDNKYLEELKKKYTELYLANLPDTNEKTIEGEKYPRFNEDLFAKNDKMYKEFEEELHIKPIEEQTEEEIWQTLKTRIDGLRECLASHNETEERKEYYKNELERELKLYEDLSKDKSIILNDKISNFCSNIYWNKRALDANPDSFSLEEFENFIHQENNKELKFLLTFISPNSDILQFETESGIIKGINKNALQRKIQERDMIMRQFIFGFGEDIKKYWPFRPFIYEAQNMLPSLEYKINCHQLVNWTLFLNMLYDYCAISNSSNYNDFPARFILPQKEFSRIDNETPPDKGVKIRYNKKQYDLFDYSKTKFIGLLIIKNYKIKIQINKAEANKLEANKDKQIQKRLMIFYIFKNLDEKHFDRFDTLRGTVPTYFIVNNKMQFINEGQLITRPNITFIELRQFARLSDLGKIHIYRFTEYPLDLLISNKIITEDRMIKYQNQGLALEKVSITEDNEQNLLIKPLTTSLSSENLLVGGNVIASRIKIHYSKNINNFTDGQISGIYYNKFMEIIDKTIHEWMFNKNKYNKKYVIISSILFDYLLVDNYEINVFAYNFLKHPHSIVKYNPLSPKYFTCLEILEKFNILEQLSSKSNIIVVSNFYSTLEFIKFKKFHNKARTPNINFFLPKPPSNVNLVDYINNFQNIYDIIPTIFDKVIYDLLELPITNLADFFILFSI